MTKNKYKLFMILSITLLVVTIIASGTYAWYVWSTSDSEVTNIVAGIGAATVTFDGGSDINANLRPVSDKSKGISKTIKVKADTTGLVFNLYLDITTLDTNLKHESFKYELYKGTTKVKEGNFSDTYLTSNTSTCTTNNTTHITLLTDESISTSNTEYTLYLWIDGVNYTNPSTMMNKSFTFKLHADGEGAVVSYIITNEDGSDYTPTYTGSGTKVVKSSAPLSKFKEVKVDNETVDSSNYTLSEGSTIVTFKESYLKTLSVGNHNLKIVSNDGIASGVLTVKEVITAATYITNLYNNSSKTSVTNNSITYQYDTTNSLMKDVGDNIHYYGASPNNYIYFNCSDYANQSSSTCEVWRIIGVFDNKVKIMRNESIGTYAWDNKNASTGAEDAAGSNNWTTARLMKLLNSSDYYTIDSNDNGNGQSLYWNSKSGTCFSGQSNKTVDCNFNSTGIKNNITRNMIAEVIWNLGGFNTNRIYSNQIYAYERGTTVYTGRPTTWTGKIALAYPSDYGYAADLSKCTQTLYDYDNSTCTANNWMKSIFNSSVQWLLTPCSDPRYPGYAAYASSSGFVNSNDAYFAYDVRPVLHLSSKLVIESGDGSSGNPYKLSV